MAVFELTRARKMRDARQADRPRTWDDAARRWRAESTHRAPGTIEREERLLRWLAPHLSGLTLDRVTRGKLADVRSAAIAAGWANRSTNYATGLVSTIMRAAYEWEWTPTFPRLSALKLPPHRTRYLTREEADRVLDELPPHLADMARFTLETGLRKGSLVAMRWDWLDWTPNLECVRVPAARMKQRVPLIVPLSTMALAILRRLFPRRRSDLVWTYRGKPIAEPAALAWRDAVQRAGVHDFRWHDLRHTWASWHVQSGTSLAVLKELGG